MVGMGMVVNLKPSKHLTHLCGGGERKKNEMGAGMQHPLPCSHAQRHDFNPQLGEKERKQKNKTQKYLPPSKQKAT